MNMKTTVSLLLLVLLIRCTTLAQKAPATSLAATIKDSKWQKRVLLLCAPTADNADLRRQQQLLGPARAELNTRDLLVREVLTSQLPPADQRYAREQLKVPANGFVVILIGKDGGVKRRETSPLPPAQLFSTIDAMPMRRQEMRRGN